LGELIAYLFPGGILERIFSRGITPGLNPPATLDLKIFSLTFGFTVRINLASLFGVLLGAYLYKQL
jgi:ribonuclease D